MFPIYCLVSPAGRTGNAALSFQSCTPVLKGKSLWGQEPAINLKGWRRAGVKGSHEELGAQGPVGCAGGMACGFDLAILKKGAPGQVSGHT